MTSAPGPVEIELCPGALDAVVARLMTCRDLDPLLQHVTEVVVGHTAADSAYVFMVHESGELMRAVAGVGERRERVIGVTRRRGETMSGLAWERAEPVFVADAGGDPLARLDWAPATQLFAVPLLGTDERVQGVLVAASGAGSPDVVPQLALIERLASLASIALDNARSLQTSAAELRRSRALGALGPLLNDFAGTDEHFGEVGRVLVDALDAARVDVWLTGPDGIVREHAAEALGDRAADAVAVRLAPPPLALVPETIIQWCCTHAEPVAVARDVEDPRESARVHAARRAKQVGGTACAPLLVDGRAVGAVALGRDRSQRDFDESDLHVFHSIVHQIAASIRRHELTLALEHQAYHDSLTGLPNRRHLERTLSACLQRGGARLAVLFLDLDGFKTVNDTLGHTVGDELLRRVARRLSTYVREGDLLARMGGDEFALIVHGSRTPRRGEEDAASLIAHRLVRALADHFDVGGARLRVGTSVGVSRFPDDGRNTDELLRNADVAMYRAKARGKGCVVAFDRTHAEEARERAALELELSEALGRGELRLFYQPQVRCSDGRVSALEALIRWQHPTRGLLAPGAFVPLAERSGLIREIGAWVIEEAVRQWAAWRARGGPGGSGGPVPRVAVNVAASQFRSADFADSVLECLARHAVPPAALELEVTESLFMHDVQTVVERLEELREAGVRIAVDDFGTGYSSLRYLQDLPLDVLKIDRSFVARLDGDPRPESLVGTIRSLASGLGLESVAEGIESAAQLAAVTALGCDLAQGYHFSRPLPADEVTARVAAIHAGGAASARAA